MVFVRIVIDGLLLSTKVQNKGTSVKWTSADR